MIKSEQDIFWMQQALDLARQAAENNEVPVGAILIHENTVIGKGYNQPIARKDPTAHAEILALRDAAGCIGNYRLVDTILYVTLEPCAMCIGALIQARIKKLVFGAYDPKAGAVESIFHLLDSEKLNHRILYEGGILSASCGGLLSDFFRDKR